VGAAGFAEQAAGGALAEVVFGEGLAGNELQAEAIDEGAHGFEQVASERVSAEAELVVVANGRVQPGAVQRQGDFGAGKGVAEGEQGVERVARGAAVAVFEAQAFGHDGAQAREVGAGGCAFYAAQAGQAAGLVDFLKAFLQQADGVAEFVAGVQVVVAQLFKPFALALDFGLDELAGEGQAEGVVQAEAHLGDAAARVVVGAAEHEAGAGLFAGEDDHACAAFAKLAQQAGFKGDVAAQKDAGDGGQGHGADALAVFTKDKGAGIKLKVYVAAIDKEAGHGGVLRFR
jgi:hypothetical protein